MKSFAVPDNVQARLDSKNKSKVGLPQMDAEAEEKWWAQVWRERGLPDPVTVTPAEFRRLVKERNVA